eukprot:SAG31_NODE_1670_length_7567_cov_13.084360_5_plen_102_part_00
MRNNDRVGGNVSAHPLPVGVGGDPDFDVPAGSADTERAFNIEVVHIESENLVARLTIEVIPKPFVIDSRIHIYGTQVGYRCFRKRLNSHEQLESFGETDFF